MSFFFLIYKLLWNAISLKFYSCDGFESNEHDALIGQSFVLPRVVAILCLNIDILIYHSFASVSIIKVLEYIADGVCAFTIVGNFMWILVLLNKLSMC